ncbi:MAG: hypothetical protein ABI823_14725 [Bryobacteraceae bacterium]
MFRAGFFGVLLFASPAFPSLVFHDAFPGTNGDVIGDPRSFDIQFANVLITPSTTTVELRFNFGAVGGSTLDAFQYSWSPWLSVGDLLFVENGAPKWGVPLADHAGSLNGGPDSNLLFAGQMYEVLNGGGWYTAREALNDPPNNIYRYDSPVWLRDANGSLSASGFAGFVNVDYLGGDGLVTPRFSVIVTVPTPTELYLAFQSGGLSFSFASATCGNDIISGFLDPAFDVGAGANPEPSTWILAATGLLAIIRTKRGRRARARRSGPDRVP